MLPKILQDITQHISQLCFNELDDAAIMNVFIPKLCSALATKRILTDSSMHQEPTPLCYYGLNLMPSGKSKNLSLKAVNNLFKWLDCIYENKNQIIKNEVETIANAKYKTAERREKALENVFQFNPSINGASAQKIYEIAQMIDYYDFGALFFYDTEFARKFVRSSNGGNYDNVLDMLLNLWDGEVDYTSVVSSNRTTLKSRISTSCYFATAYETLLQPNVKELFKEYGDTGFFRRTFIYVSNGEEKQNVHSTAEQRQLARQNNEYYSDVLRKLYNQIPNGITYEFDAAANIAIDNYRMSVEQVIKQKLSYDIFLSPIDKSYKINLQGSPWKIVKMAFIMHVLNDPMNNVVSSVDVDQAIEYFNLFDNYLPQFLQFKPLNERTQLRALACKNLDKTMQVEDFLNAIRDEIFFNAWYDEWNDKKRNLIKNLVADLKQQGIETQLTEQTIKFYKLQKKSNIDDIFC